ncbi:hypothetical protein U9M48_030879 [Paspalum notatum var. saurae]|uniref:Uncharacterized protein n=1 Tax=Paspalum notatum var. saurae TaxID=547442 RepID=A0AAQ3U1F4_PASNO
MCPWVIQGVQFSTSFKILPLNCYDAILGMEWIEQFSPMSVQWAEKWLSFVYNKQQGIVDSNVQLNLISGDQLNAITTIDLVFCVVHVYAIDSAEQFKPELPFPIQELIQQFAILFEEPSGEAPSQTKRHTIPLLPSTQPFRL